MWSCKTIIIFLLLPYFVAPEESIVYNYGSENFKKQIEQMDGNFIMFYAPWCRHCTDFHPIWEELAELVNTEESRFAIAQVDCTQQSKLCNDNDITGYPTLHYYHKSSFQPLEYKGTRDLPSLTLFLSEAFTLHNEEADRDKEDAVRVYSGMAYLNDHNVEKYLSTGQHFVMFYASWCRASQKLAPVWAELAVHYSTHSYVQVGKINCMESAATCENFDVKQYPYLMWILNGRIMGVTNNEQTLDQLKSYVEKMVLTENHDPDKFTRREKILPVARITEETFETFFERDIVFVNYFAPWCGHCMQLSPLWTQLGERFRNESRVLIADVDCAQSKNICALEKITSLPTLILYKQKKIVITETGGKPLDSLVALVQEQLDGAGNVPVQEDTTGVPLDGAGNILVNEGTTDVPLDGATNILVQDDTTSVPLDSAGNILVEEDPTDVPLDGTERKEDTTNSSGDSTIANDKDILAKDEL